MKFYRYVSIAIFLMALVACSKKRDTNFTLTGKIKGLKKGIVYLQKEGDSTIINLDSMVINGEPDFTLKTNLDEPLLLYLKLFKNDGEEHFIPFFADTGRTTITSTLKQFNYDAVVKGSEEQDLLNDYTKVSASFNNQNLSIIEGRLLAQKDGDSIKVDSLNKESDILLKRKYSFSIQFALNNTDNIIAPYLALYEIPSANPIYIDSVYNNLNEDIKNSFYGLKLKEVIDNRAQ